MFKILTKNRKGFTLVELVAVIGLLGLGAVALVNLFLAGWRAFDKSEQRYVKQEAVKEVAELLRSGSSNVAAAETADVFPIVDVVPNAANIDEAYSYLYIEPYKEGDEYKGYYIYSLNKGQSRDAVEPLSEEPIYVSIDVMDPTDEPDYVAPTEPSTTEPSTTEASIETTTESTTEKATSNYCGVVITLAALDDGYEYKETTKTIKVPVVQEDGSIKAEEKEFKVLEDPPSDYMFYKIDVAYHFPNMATSENNVTVNFAAPTLRSTANVYEQPESGFSGIIDESVKNVYAVDEGGIVLRVYADSIISGDNTNTDVSVPKLCFIATASYGNDSGEVGMLCHFRDSVLKQSALGRAFIKAYYAISPPIAEFISQSEPLKAAVRFALKPMVMLATFATDSDLATDNIGWLALLGISALGIGTVTVTYGVRKHKAKKANSGQG